MIHEETLKATLAALLHDIGKFWRRAGRPGNHGEASAAFVDEFEHLFPYDWKDDIRDGAGNHHHVARKQIEKVVKAADWLSSAEREQEPSIPRQDPDRTPLIPVTSRIKLLHDSSYNPQQSDWRFRLDALSFRSETVFPHLGVEVSPADYSSLWRKFADELRTLSMVDSAWKIVGFLSILRKYTTFVPSATPWEEDEEFRTLPDISLYDHLKITAAIAACVSRLFPDHLEELLRALSRRDPRVLEKPVCQMVRGDISGIQKFIYRITKPQAEAKGTAKRLRGRSFYLSLLSDVIADWFVRELALTAANILFCSGGKFDLLLAIDDATRKKLRECEEKLQRWIVENRFFQGELGIQIAHADVKPSDFSDLRGIYGSLEDRLMEEKQRKFLKFLDHNGFFTPEARSPQKPYDVCHVCQITSIIEPRPPEDRVCDLCEQHGEIGGKLPKTDCIAFLYGDAIRILPEEASLDFIDLFGVSVKLLNEQGEGEARQLLRSVQGTEVDVVLYRLNSTDFIFKEAPSNVAFGFRFFGNEAPTAVEDLPPVRTGKEKIRKDDVLDFEEIASLSAGAKVLGVLKADVDRMGTIFGEGVEPRSISRISTLSNSFDLFFAGWLSEICARVADKWHSDPNNPNKLKGKVKGILYIVYSGGDDLFIIGPWDQIIDLAQELYTNFREYTCQNSNITLSAGILLVKPHFPIQRFAHLASMELEKSKTYSDKRGEGELKEKDRITIFGESMKWKEGMDSFQKLIELGKALAVQVDAKEHPIPKSFVYFLKTLHDQHFGETGSQRLMWIPNLRYAIARRLRKEVIIKPELGLLFGGPSQDTMRRIIIPVSYVSLKTRKE